MPRAATRPRHPRALHGRLARAHLYAPMPPRKARRMHAIHIHKTALARGRLYAPALLEAALAHSAMQK